MTLQAGLRTLLGIKRPPARVRGKWNGKERSVATAKLHSMRICTDGIHQGTSVAFTLLGLRFGVSRDGTNHGLIDDIQRVNDRAVWAFVPQPYAGLVTLFKPQKNYDFMSDPQMGWGDLVRSGPEVVELPVNPHAMLIEPFVQILGRELRYRIRARVATSAA